MSVKYTTEAIVIGTANFGDADRVLTLFTKARGKVRAAAFGSRRPKSLLSGLQLFVRAEMQLVEGRNLDTVKSFALLDGNSAITADLTATAYAAFAAEIAGDLFAENQPDEAAFVLLSKILAAFAAGRNPRVTALIAAWQLLYAAGVGASLERCADCADKIGEQAYFSPHEGGVLCQNCGRGKALAELTSQDWQFLRTMRDFDWDANEKLRLKKDVLLTAERNVLSYLRNILGREPRSLGFIRGL